MKRRKICAVTGSRAEYDLLVPLLKMIDADADLRLQLVVTGMHLSPAFGLTVRGMEADGLVVERTCDMLLSSDTPVGVTKSMGVGMIGFADIFDDLRPDMVLVLGDRFEIFAAAAAAFMAGIPVAHLHGGEITEGALDEGLRHAITKMSHLHFTSTESYRQRVIQLGEDPDCVFNVGAVGVENIRNTQFPGRQALEKRIGFDLRQPFLIVTYHPETVALANTLADARHLLESLEDLEDIRIIFTGSNADARGRAMNRLIREFVDDHHDRSVFFESMGQHAYLGAARFAAAVVGNSSSGIIEIPSLGVPTVNIGGRQKGRIRAHSVIDCPPRKEAIQNSIRQALSEEFKQTLEDVRNPYEQADTKDRIRMVLKTADLASIRQKSFHDLAVDATDRE
ncbi:UDP-N,N'-diacetylbacillosamine 2-epimerase (hydrolyzing) (EC [Olavius algarvensis associated proteobacterium Delta 3]|nr:UDP-N,N'-diacetylbacillosamine 2-epimerase (hydrolyzing) (EC [Olavius algarvensis associated proteobacterium Delta 3]